MSISNKNITNPRTIVIIEQDNGIDRNKKNIQNLEI